MLNLAGLCVLVPDDTNGFAGTFAGPRVGGSPLPPHGQAAAVPDSAITIDGLETLEVALQFAAKIAFDQHFVSSDGLDDVVDLVRGQVLRPQIWIDVGLFKDASGRARPNPVDIRERRFDAFFGRNLNSK